MQRGNAGSVEDNMAAPRDVESVCQPDEAAAWVWNCHRSRWKVIRPSTRVFFWSRRIMSDKPKFGQMMRGTYASADNPQRDGMYVRTILRKGRVNPGKYYELTDGNGHFWNYPIESIVFLEV